ncbi:MAG: NADP-dependent isocitrate dehydrogenase [Thermoflexales bacterium]
MSASSTIPITVAYGDGIGPEITEAVLRILQAAGAPLKYDVIEVGQKAQQRGYRVGIAPESWEVLQRNAAFLKAPITTQLGKGDKSFTVTARLALDLFANVRPVRSYEPFVASARPGVDVVIVRENEEDVYVSVEHRRTPEVIESLKLVTRPGVERIIRYAFEYARARGRRKVTCMTKDNILKMADGLFHRVFEEIAAQHPDIQSEHMIVDIGAARLATQPERFDVIVTLNLYGDILSDVAAQVAGSVGLAGSANIGPNAAMFEAVHGSAPDIAGQGVANPSGLLMAAVQMLVHLGLVEHAAYIENAWLRTLEDGIHTADLYRSGVSRVQVGTQEFANAVIERLGESPRHLKPAFYRAGSVRVAAASNPPMQQTLVGVDVWVRWDEDGRDPEALAARWRRALPEGWQLTLITNRGVKVYPSGFPQTFCTDHWCCRCISVHPSASFDAVLDLLHAICRAGFVITKAESLYHFDGEHGYTLGQGE